MTMTNPTVDPSDTIAIDAYTGSESVSGRFVSEYREWALGTPQYGKPTMRPAPLDPANWRDERVGWGIILAKRADMSPEELATASDAPTPIQELVAARAGKVLRYCPGTAFGNWTLRDYAAQDEIFTPAAAVGMGPQQLPKYLLIYATPAEVPWHIQYGLNPVRYVGRLDLSGEAIENYVGALLDNWTNTASSYDSPVVWAVEHHAGDITELMRDTVAEPIYKALADDDEMPSATFIDGRDTPATTGSLRSALVANNPALVVTSSHGMTGPLSDPDAMRANLGLPVDQAHDVLSPDALLADWLPDGAIWFAQACCSAGSDSPTIYRGLFEAGSPLDETLNAVGKVGATTAPLPRALLGAPKPARAFIGHVEPTFNWTLSFPPNRSALTDELKKALYNGLTSGLPVGLAMSDYYRAIGSLLHKYEKARQEFNAKVGAAAKPSLDMLVYSRVTAHDRASTVILGDPTAAMALPTQP
jgi:hypothetical protein